MSYLIRNVCFARNRLSIANKCSLSSFIRQSSSISSSSKPKNPPKEYREGFQCVYRFKYINHLRLLNRFKLYQTAFSCCAAIASTAMYSLNYVTDISTLLVINGSMWLALVMLLIISRHSVRVVGALYVNESEKKALISHLNFYAKRKDIELKLSSIEPLASMDELRDAYLKLRVFFYEVFLFVFLYILLPKTT